MSAALRRRDDLAGLKGELQHQPLAGDERAGGRAGVAADGQVGCVEQLVVADLDGAPQLTGVAAAGSVDEARVQGGEALQTMAGGVGLNDPDVSADAGIERVGQMFHEQRGHSGRRHRGATAQAGGAPL
ncbi:hypothetical protein [Streptomyces sp. JNUCC 63]